MTTKLSDLIIAFKVLLRQLWLSVSSVNFYQDVFRIYSGYGLKYLFTIAFISSVIFCSVILNHVISAQKYFSYGLLLKETTNIDHIFKQLPDLNYDGKNISIENETPLYIFDISNRKVAVIDLEGKVSIAEKNKIPLVMNSSNIIFSIIWGEKKVWTYTISYPEILGTDAQIINQETVKKIFADLFSSAPRIVIYLVMPLIAIFLLLATILEKVFIILPIYLVMSFFGTKTSFKNCIRIVFFSSGAGLILHSITAAAFPSLNFLVGIVKMWCSILLFMAIVKSKNTEIN